MCLWQLFCWWLKLIPFYCSLSSNALGRNMTSCTYALGTDKVVTHSVKYIVPQPLVLSIKVPVWWDVWMFGIWIDCFTLLQLWPLFYKTFKGVLPPRENSSTFQTNLAFLSTQFRTWPRRLVIRERCIQRWCMVIRPTRSASNIVLLLFFTSLFLSGWTILWHSSVH